MYEEHGGAQGSQGMEVHRIQSGLMRSLAQEGCLLVLMGKDPACPYVQWRAKGQRLRSYLVFSRAPEGGGGLSCRPQETERHWETIITRSRQQKSTGKQQETDKQYTRRHWIRLQTQVTDIERQAETHTRKNRGQGHCDAQGIVQVQELQTGTHGETLGMWG